MFIIIIIIKCLSEFIRISYLNLYYHIFMYIIIIFYIFSSIPHFACNTVDFHSIKNNSIILT